MIKKSFMLSQFKANLLAFRKEAIWCNQNYVPSLKEYLMNSTTSSGLCVLGLAIILGMRHDDTIRACKWATQKPKAVVATETVGRIMNDIVGYQVCCVFTGLAYKKRKSFTLRR